MHVCFVGCFVRGNRIVVLVSLNLSQADLTGNLRGARGYGIEERIGTFSR